MKVLGRDTNELAGFYKELADLPRSNEHSRIGERMLSLLPRLEAALAGKTVWATTSHDRLCLSPREDAEPVWLVTVQAVSWGGFEVRYLLPEADAPWVGAMVEGFYPG